MAYDSRLTGTTTIAAIVGLVVLVLVLAVGLSAGLAAVCMLLWNAAAVPAFGAPVLDFWAAWGLWALVCLVGGVVRTTVNAGRRNGG